MFRIEKKTIKELGSFQLRVLVKKEARLYRFALGAERLYFSPTNGSRCARTPVWLCLITLKKAARLGEGHAGGCLAGCDPPPPRFLTSGCDAPGLERARGTAFSFVRKLVFLNENMNESLTAREASKSFWRIGLQL